MKIPQKMLDDMSYYTYTYYINDFYDAAYDIIIIHFKQWWKPSKKISSRMNQDGKCCNFTSNKEFLELLEQLKSKKI